MNQHVVVSLSFDEAVVLFEWLVRFNKAADHRFEDQAEQRVLWNLESLLEQTMTSPLAPDYRELLVLARERLRDRKE